MRDITVVGVGYEAGQLTLDAVAALTSGAEVWLHTARCGCAGWLTEKGIAFRSMDDLYDEYEDFDEHNEAVTDRLLEAAEEKEVVYGVFDVRDRTVSELTSRTNHVRVIAGPPAEGALLGYVTGQTAVCEASGWEDFLLTSDRAALIRELDTRELAAEVKLKLSEHYPDETEIWVLSDGSVRRIKLYELDRMEHYDHRTSVLVPAAEELTELERYDMGQLLRVMRRLLAPGGCPWDRAQTHESLRRYIVEEAYEVIDAIDAGDTAHLYDELGDMLFQIVFHSEIARLHGEFDFSDVTTAICEKMISRHTHIFGKDRVTDAESVADLWSRNKMAERGQKTYTETLRDIVRSLPAQLRACKAVKRCETALRLKADAKSALEAARERIGQGISSEETLGEALLAMMCAAKALDIDPELALNGAVDRLVRRFGELEEKTGCIDALSEEKRREYWSAVKLPKATENG